MKMRMIIGLLAGMMLLGGCARRRVIPDDKLIKILREIYLDNTYASQQNLPYDSIDIYTPILKKHGYKPRDLHYTFNEFSKRKSSRISTLIETTVKELDKELEWFTQRVAVLDTINLMARERFKKVVYTDSLITARKISDTTKLRIKLPATEGVYRIGYGYRMDSTDRNVSLRTTHVLLDSSGRQVTSNTNWMSSKKQFERQIYTIELNATPLTTNLEILFGNYSKEMTTPHLRIDSLTIIYYLPVEQALDSLRRYLYAYRLIINETEYPPQDRGALSLLPPRMAPQRDSLP